MTAYMIGILAKRLKLYEAQIGGDSIDIRSASSMNAASSPTGVSVAPMASRPLFLLLYLAAALLLLPATTLRAQSVGDLGVSPTRVVLAGRVRTAEIMLLNRGTQPATYRISIVNMRMTETGKFELIENTEAGQKFADKLVRYAPRQITLDPGATQTVRVMARKPRDLPPGEYRSHLYFRAVPPPGAGHSVEFADSGQGIQINLVVIPGVTIPVIVRHGELSAQATLSDINVSGLDAPEGPKLSLRINRQGDRSLFGDLTAAFFAADGNKEQIVMRINKLAVYTPNPSRLLVLPLHLPDGASLSGGRLHILYRTRQEEGAEVIAEAKIQLP